MSSSKVTNQAGTYILVLPDEEDKPGLRERIRARFSDMALARGLGRLEQRLGAAASDTPPESANRKTTQELLDIFEEYRVAFDNVDFYSAKDIPLINSGLLRLGGRHLAHTSDIRRIKGSFERTITFYNNVHDAIYECLGPKLGEYSFRELAETLREITTKYIADVQLPIQGDGFTQDCLYNLVNLGTFASMLLQRKMESYKDGIKNGIVFTEDGDYIKIGNSKREITLDFDKMGILRADYLFYGLNLGPSDDLIIKNAKGHNFMGHLRSIGSITLEKGIGEFVLHNLACYGGNAGEVRILGWTGDCIAHNPAIYSQAPVPVYFRNLRNSDSSVSDDPFSTIYVGSNLYFPESMPKNFPFPAIIFGSPG